ncbi:MAG: NAD(P)/FAD-dependent oxidoreductase [Pseudomonadota bacterium]
MGDHAEFDADCVVLGAGVVGLAVARACARAGRDVLVVEAASGIGTETSARNSEVIHAGIYYPQGSLKAEACVRGKALLYEFLQSRSIDHRQCGKFIVASTEAEADELETIQGKGAANGVSDLEIISGDAAMAAEPGLNVKAAIWSPSTGILDSHGYMVALQGEAEDHGAMIAFETRVSRGEVQSDGRTKLWCEGAEPCIVTANTLINCAGLHAPTVAAAIEGIDTASVPTPYFAKGNYFTLSARAPFSRLIYPVPQPGGLGVHLTIDLGGQARFGPDVEWLDEIDYRVDPSRADSFYDAIRAYWPDLQDGALHPDYSGIRPKISGPGQGAADFSIMGPEDHSAPGQVHMFGIESPGLTSSLALAERVLEAVKAL